MKISQNLAILFFANKSKEDAFGYTPIYCRITLDQKRAQFSTGKKIDANKWVAKQGYVLNSHDDAKTINIELDSIKSDLRKTFHHLIAINNQVTAETLLNEYLGKSKKYKTVIELFTHYNSLLKQKSETPEPSISPKTVTRFEITKNKIIDFIKYEYQVNDKFLNELKSGFGEDLHFYLTTIKKIGSNTAMKYIKNTKQVFSYALVKEWIPSNPLGTFKCTYRSPIRERLTMEELNTIYKKEISVKRIDEVRDVFIFSCYTGFAYQDTYDLSSENLIIGIDGEKWLTKARQKTETVETVPLLPVALEIISKYKNHPYCVANNKLLPVNSNQRYNSYLEELAGICGIKKNLTTHTARHTFATTVTLENDVPIETVSQMLGHKSLRTTQIYAKITQKKMSNNMKELKEKLFPKNNSQPKIAQVH